MRSCGNKTTLNKKRESIGCRPNSEGLDYQRFPTSGPLFRNMNTDWKSLKEVIYRKEPKVIYSYVLTSYENRNGGFFQTGCGPNFQGGHLTLCTCMHQMRSGRDSNEWKENVWIAGVTSTETGKGKNYLLYFAKVLEAFDSQMELHNSNLFTPSELKAKIATYNVFGDIFEPISKNDLERKLEVDNYEPPIKRHKHESIDKWKHDVCYFRDGWNRYQSFLLFDPTLSFLWSKPQIEVSYKDKEGNQIVHPRAARRFENYNEFLSMLKGRK